jgi:acyl carrier protein
VAALIPRSDHAAIKAQVLSIAGELLRELGNDTTIEPLQGSESLEQELGLGSIERVELLSRIERSLGAPLPEQRLAEAKTLDDIITAIAEPEAPAGVEESVPVGPRGVPRAIPKRVAVLPVSMPPAVRLGSFNAPGKRYMEFMLRAFFSFGSRLPGRLYC